MKTIRDIVFGMSIMGLIINLIDFFVHNNHNDLTILALILYSVYFIMEISLRVIEYINEYNEKILLHNKYNQHNVNNYDEIDCGGVFQIKF